MARKKDIDFTLRGEVEQQKSEAIISDVLTEEQIVNNKNDDKVGHVVFKLVDTKRNGGTYIPNEDDVIHPKTKKPARMRLLSGVESIWVSEQKEITKEYADQNRRSIMFPRGQKFIAVPSWDKTMLEFLRRTRHNIGSPDRKTGSHFEFFEYNPEKQAKQALENELFEIEMVTEAQKQPIEYVRKHAVYLGIPMIDQHNFPKSDTQLRQEYIVFAKRNPKQFKESLVNKRDVEVSYMVRKLLSEGQIDIHAVQGAAIWASNQKTICRMPSNVSAAEHLTGLALTSSAEGIDFLKGVQALSQ